MKQPIVIPSLGESVSEATISRIIKKSGTMVKTDEEIIELETEKVNQVLFAPTSGEIEFTVQEGQTVKVGEVIGSVDTSKTASAAPETTKTEAPRAEAPKEVAPTPPKEAPKPKASSEPLRQSEEAWLQAARPQAARPQAANEVKPASKEQEASKSLNKVPQRIKMTKLRKTIAARLLEAKNTTAMLTTFNEVDMTACMEIRAKEQEEFTKKYGIKLGFMSFFVKATVSALKAYPEINAYIDGEDIVRLATFDIGIAVATDKGLLVPVVRDCDILNYGEIEQKIDQYAKAARNSSLKIEDLRGGSFTITNGGRFGSLLSTPLLNIPQSAILGMHAIVKRPIAMDGQIVIRPMMYLALSYDHRLVDGREAVLFLVHIKEHLENPSKLLLDL